MSIQLIKFDLLIDLRIGSTKIYGYLQVLLIHLCGVYHASLSFCFVFIKSLHVSAINKYGHCRVFFSPRKMTWRNLYAVIERFVTWGWGVGWFFVLFFLHFIWNVTCICGHWGRRNAAGCGQLLCFMLQMMPTSL